MHACARVRACVCACVCVYVGGAASRLQAGEGPARTVPRAAGSPMDPRPRQPEARREGEDASPAQRLPWPQCGLNPAEHSEGR